MATSPALPLSERQRAQLGSYADAVRASPHNLLSRRGLEELESRHIPECLGLAATLPSGPAAVLDLGSGGGLPGIVIAVARPDLQLTLLDATAKKVAFLAETAAAIGIEVETLTGRAEELVTEHRSRMDVVVARAVAPLPRLIGWSLPWLRPRGTLHAVKGERWEDELRDAVPELRRHRARVAGTTEPGRRVPTGPDGDLDGVTPRVVIIQAPD